VLAAVDFSSACVRALTLGRELLRPNGKVTLAHVISPDLDEVNWNGTNAGYHGTVGRAMDRVIAEMGLGDVQVERRILSGDASKELLKLQDELQPDLIVTGSHGHNFLTRLLLGSVSTKLIRRGNCSVLVAPPVEGEEYMDELPQATTQFSHYEWAERLEEFTRRNAGRRGTLEEIHPEIGAHVQEKHAVFAGVSFDPRDGRVIIMFGPVGAVDQHFSRSIAGITAVQMLRDRTGRDLLLRVAHGRGQTLLTLER
jgi:universal stress protein A